MSIRVQMTQRDPGRRFAAASRSALGSIAMFAAAPFIGLAFIVLLPLAGLVLLVATAAGGITSGSGGARWNTSTPRLAH